MLRRPPRSTRKESSAASDVYQRQDAEVAFSDVRLSVLLDEITDRFKPMAASQQVFLHVDCQPLCVHANLQQMKELFGNLIGNAVKYNRPGGQVWISVRQQDQGVSLRVRDNGVGIPKESLDRIFERFYRVDKSRSKSTGGTGLGLAIVKHIVAQHDAQMTLTSEVGVGTEIKIVF